MAVPTNLGLYGPYALTEENVNKYAATDGAGVYALDKTSTGPFTVSYVGRSDDQLNTRLLSWAAKGTYKYFQYGYLSSAEKAFNKECELYHDWNPPDNTLHPDRPKGTKLQCPRGKCLP